MGYFFLNDRDGAKFSSGAGDMKLEQTQNRFSQGPGCHVVVGKAAVAEFNMLFYEAKSMTNLLNALINARLMDHTIVVAGGALCLIEMWVDCLTMSKLIKTHLSSSQILKSHFTTLSQNRWWIM